MKTDIAGLLTKIAGINTEKGTAMYEMLSAIESVPGRIEENSDFPENMHEFLLETLEDMKVLIKEDYRKFFIQLPLYQREFYDAIKEHGIEKLPEFLNNGDWEDTSWHNNEFPSWFNKKLNLELFINFQEKAVDYQFAYMLQKVDKDREYLDEDCFDTIEELEKAIKKIQEEK